jgi:hypothetical protein
VIGALVAFSKSGLGVRNRTKRQFRKFPFADSIEKNEDRFRKNERELKHAKGQCKLADRRVLPTFTLSSPP